MKKFQTEIANNSKNLFITSKRSTLYLVILSYFIIGLIISSILSTNFEVEFKVVFLIITPLIIIISYFKFNQVNKFRLTFDKEHNAFLTNDKIEKQIDEIEFLSIVYDKSKLDVNECLLKIHLYDGSDIILTKADAQYRSQIIELGKIISKFINRPLQEFGKPWII